MFNCKTLAGAAVLATVICVPARATVIYSTDFNSYTAGSVVGQDGWTDDTSPGQNQPDIMLDPTGAGHGNVLRLESANADDTTWSGCYRGVGDLPQTGTPVFSLSWDQFRRSTGDNLWFAEDISYSDWFGFEWDQAGTIQPQFSGNGEMALTAAKWQTIQFDFDYTNSTIEGFVDGVSGGKKAFIGNFQHWRGLDLEIVGTAAKGGNNGPNYIDNIRVTAPSTVPEPGSLALLATGLLPLLGLRRRK